MYKRLEMYHPKNTVKVVMFCFEDEEDYEKFVKLGWKENVAKQEATITEEPKSEELSDTVFTCDICGYEGKSETSLRMHKLHKHKDK